MGKTCILSFHEGLDSTWSCRGASEHRSPILISQAGTKQLIDLGGHHPHTKEGWPVNLVGDHKKLGWRANPTAYLSTIEDYPPYSLIAGGFRYYLPLVVLVTRISVVIRCKVSQRLISGSEISVDFTAGRDVLSELDPSLL
jgi:hypothetical protein